mgnify:CR=1 FL=1
MVAVDSQQVTGLTHRNGATVSRPGVRVRTRVIHSGVHSVIRVKHGFTLGL